MAAKKPKKSKDGAGGPRKRGRPALEFTPEQEAQIAQYAYNGCHLRTIARITDIDDSTLTRHFEALIAKKRAEGRAALHERQMQGALAGDNTMLIWLGKQRLGQADKAEVEQTHTLKLYDKVAPTDEV